MQKYVAEFIGTFFLVLIIGCTVAVGRGRVDPARHSVGGDERDDDCGSRAHRSKTGHISNRHAVPTR